MEDKILTSLELESHIKQYLNCLFEGGLFLTGTVEEKTEKGLKHLDSFLEQSREYQAKNKISSIYYKDLEWSGYKITCPFYSFYLGWSLKDVRHLKQEKNRLLNWFIDFATLKIEKENYSLFREDYDEGDDENEGEGFVDIPIDLKTFKSITEEFDWVELIEYENYLYPVYLEEDLDLIDYWKCCYSLSLKRGYSLNLEDIIENDAEQKIHLIKTFKTKPPNYI